MHEKYGYYFSHSLVTCIFTLYQHPYGVKNNSSHEAFEINMLFACTTFKFLNQMIFISRMLRPWRPPRPTEGPDMCSLYVPHTSVIVLSVKELQIRISLLRHLSISI
jgi:hypothetical protein